MQKDLLIVIDMQNVYAAGGAWCCPGAEKASEKICSLIDDGKDGLDIVFTRFIASETSDGIWKDYNRENAEINSDAHANEIMDIFHDYIKKYPLYTKSVYSSLSIPEIKESIGDYQNIVLTGVVSECCVLSTAMALIDAGAHVIYLKDAAAGISRSTEAAVETVLEGLAPLHVNIMTTCEYLKVLMGESVID